MFAISAMPTIQADHFSVRIQQLAYGTDLASYTRRPWLRNRCVVTAKP
jgi:hypothetical protein